METIDKKGRKITRADFPAQGKKAGQHIIYIVDAETHHILEEILGVLNKIELHQSLGSDVELGGDD